MPDHSVLHMSGVMCMLVKRSQAGAWEREVKTGVWEREVKAFPSWGLGTRSQKRYIYGTTTFSTSDACPISLSDSK